MEKALRIQQEIQRIFGDTPVNLVGGATREIILGGEPKDWDYSTSLTPDEIEDKIRAAARKPYCIGKKFGTVGFKVPYLKLVDGGDNLSLPKYEFEYVEVTTYRSEKYDGKSRKPQVEFVTDIDLDLSRRDFTINAIILNKDGSFYDPFSGRIDIQRKLIKSVGDARDRLNDDPLRILRAIRFSAQLNFTIEPNLLGKMRQMNSTILRVSKERWVQEIDKMLLTDNPSIAVEHLYETGALKYVLPELYVAMKDDETRENVYLVLSAKCKDIDDGWYKLLYFIGYPASVKHQKHTATYPNNELIRKELILGIAARLKFSNDRLKNLLINRKFE